MSLITTLFSFDGRISRKTYWLAAVSLTIFAFVIVFGKALVLRQDFWGDAVPADAIDLFIEILLAIPCAALAVKRLNDISWPAWLGYASAVTSVLFCAAQYAGFDPMIKLTPVTIGLECVAYINLAFSLLIGVKKSSTGDNPNLCDAQAKFV
jgi:uncharacterized membrane protein YhaH (DUF805 family)